MWAAVALVALLALVNRTAALTVLTHRWTLLVVQVVLLAWAVLWAVLLVDAWRLGQPDRLPRRDRRGLLVLLLALLLVLPGGAAYAGMNVGAARAAMTSVFASGEAAGAVDGRYNILLLGGDSGAGRVGLRPDSIQLASVDAETGRAVLFGFSRETENIRFRPGSVMAGLMPQGWTCGDECLLNGLYTWGTDHSEGVPRRHQGPRPARHHRGGRGAHRPRHPVLRARRPQGLPQPGRRGRRASTSPCSGARRSAPSTRSRAGSRPATSTSTATTPSGTPAAAPTPRTTSGWRASAASITSMVNQLDPQTVVLHFADIAKATKGVFRTDIPQEALASLATLAVKTKQQKITSVNFVPPLIQPCELRPAGRARHRRRDDRGRREGRRAGGRPTAPAGAPRRPPQLGQRQGDEAEEAGGHGAPGHRPGRQHQRPGEHLLGRLTALAAPGTPTRRM